MRHAVIVLVAVSCLSVLARTQTAEELVNKNLQAKGEPTRSRPSSRYASRANSAARRGGSTQAIVQENLRPNLVRESFSLQG